MAQARGWVLSKLETVMGIFQWLMLPVRSRHAESRWQAHQGRLAGGGGLHTRGTVTQPGHAGSRHQHGSEHAGVPLQQQASKQCKPHVTEPDLKGSGCPTWDMMRLWLVCLGPCWVMRDPGPSSFRMLMGHVLSTCSTLMKALNGMLGKAIEAAELSAAHPS